MDDLNLFIGANAAGKSTILDALRFLHEAVLAHDFRSPAFARGGFIHMAWKGQAADEISITVFVKDAEDCDYEWSLRFTRDGHEFYVEERLCQHHASSPPSDLLVARRGEGWWWSGNQNKVNLNKNKTTCALAAASADASFPARHIADFIGRWGFFDPNPFFTSPRLAEREFRRVRSLRPQSGRNAFQPSKFLSGIVTKNYNDHAFDYGITLDHRNARIRKSPIFRAT